MPFWITLRRKESKYEINKTSNELFYDAQDTEYSGKYFPKVGVTGSSGYVYSLPGYVDTDSNHQLSPFIETLMRF